MIILHKLRPSSRGVRPVNASYRTDLGGCEEGLYPIRADRGDNWKIIEYNALIEK
jgi:hypothetical protein